MNKFTTFIILLGLISVLEVKAQGPPIFTDTPIMLGIQGRGVRTFGNIASKENANAYAQVLVVPYNITSKWQIDAVVSYLSISPNAAPNQSGFGDVKFFTKYAIYQKDGKGKTLRSLIKITETFPTGNTSEIPTLGAGTWQTTVSLVNGYVTTKYAIYGEVGYNATGNALPDNFIYNIAFGYPLLPQKYPPKQVNIYLELNGNYVFDSIGNSLFVSPGL